jgi:hypothetical protein
MCVVFTSERIAVLGGQATGSVQLARLPARKLVGVSRGRGATTAPLAGAAGAAGGHGATDQAERGREDRHVDQA